MMDGMKASGETRLHAIRADVDAFLVRYYDERVAQAEALHGDYGTLWRAMRELGVTGGKRLRPYVMLMAYEGLGGKDYGAVLPVAVALEVLHTSMLMHDDIIDHDFVRYGRANVAGQYREIYGDKGLDKVDTTHYANAAALLAGDLALSGAYELILGGSLPAEMKIKAQQVMNRSIFAVVGGELLDAESALKSFEDVDSLVVADLKTASYSFVGPLVMGGTLAGADAKTLQLLEKTGRSLGIAYQLADDIIGLFGDEAVTGKSSVSDLQEGKRTYMMRRTLELAKPSERERLMGILGGSVTPENAELARRIVRDSGALDETRALMRRYADEVRQTLQETPIDEAVRAELILLMRMFIDTHDASAK